ncbi:uncharacterized protein EKO05_0001404 [Ascochyta rabiei]|uniref:DASH complex subunit DAD3 n=1 Tax=Didymella rabiei TaxID=5454 RepID=A0A163AHP2_DIDRA|nr:uncharacterized protein EKO05_0001404 [Ascochyta rabiei]KZM21196.1 attachment of spindle microtubules to kinetochore [Ascochyta rabiei]UPX10765.1 hypothetical protein EKO05_0001404 [Ascochyta rabiei]
MADAPHALHASSTTTTGVHAGEPFGDEESLTPLEQEVLDEYARLLANMNSMAALLASLSEQPSAAILDGLRGLERKTSLVFTLLKASVYSIVLNQQIQDGGQQQQEDGAREGGSEGWE